MENNEVFGQNNKIKNNLRSVICELSDNYRNNPDSIQKMVLDVGSKYSSRGQAYSVKDRSLQLIVLDEIFNQKYLENEEFINSCILNNMLSLKDLFSMICRLVKIIEEEVLRNEGFREKLHHQIVNDMNDIKFLNTKEEREKYNTDILSKTYKLRWQIMNLGQDKQ